MSSSDASPPRALTADLFVTLDGYAKGEHSAAYFGMLGPQLQRWIERELAPPQTVVMGRVTYEALARYDDGTGPLSAIPKLVVSRTLTEASWGETTIVRSDEELQALKRAPGPPLRIMGSVSLVQRLLSARALDRLRLVVFPLLLGDTGRERLFDHLPDITLALAGSEILDDRLIVLDYTPAQS